MKSIIPIILAIGIFSCRDVVNVNQPSPTPTPTVTPVVPTNNIIEYRVQGNASSAKIKFSFPTDGLTLLTSVLPYDTTYSTPLNTVFVSLEATPVSYPFNILTPFLSVQIFANGNIFREATSSDFLLGTISVNGTWRK
jgi:hypothetical protein